MCPTETVPVRDIANIYCSMDEHQYRALQRKTGEILTLQESKTKLSTLQNVLPVSGEFKAIARNKTRGIQTKFIVVKGKINSPPLLGRRALFELGMLDIRPEQFMKVLNKTEQIAHMEGRTSTSAIQYMLMGYRSTPHPATGYSPYEALMKRDVRTKLDFKPFSRKRDTSQMEKEITNTDKEYKKNWDKYHRHPVCKEHTFKWSPAHEKEYYVKIEMHGSSIKAKRNTDGRTLVRDSTKFKRFYTHMDGNWRERLLRSSKRKQQVMPNREDRERDEQHHQEQQEAYGNQDENGHREEEETGRNQQSMMTGKRELPKRKRQLPSKFKDYIVGFKNRETEL